MSHTFEIMDERNLAKIDYEDKDFKISLERNRDIESEKHNEDGWITAPTVGVYLNIELPLKIGQKVKEGEVIFVINSMKVLNNIVAPRDGIVEEIAVKENDMLEYNQKVIKLG